MHSFDFVINNCYDIPFHVHIFATEWKQNCLLIEVVFSANKQIIIFNQYSGKKV